jgi:hypothetical protein
MSSIAQMALAAAGAQKKRITPKLIAPAAGAESPARQGLGGNSQPGQEGGAAAGPQDDYSFPPVL